MLGCGSGNLFPSTQELGHEVVEVPSNRCKLNRGQLSHIGKFVQQGFGSEEKDKKAVADEHLLTPPHFFAYPNQQ